MTPLVCVRIVFLFSAVHYILNSKVNLMTHRFKEITGFLLLYIFAHTAFSQITVTPDKAGYSYNAGELMNFVVTAESAGTATYEIRYDVATPILAKGSVEVTAGTPAYIPFRADSPCFVLCKVEMNGASDLAGAAFSRDDIDSYEEEPADFEEYWANAKAELATIPLDPHVTFLEDSYHTHTYKVDLASVHNRRVYGYVSIPEGEGPFPAILILPPYGSDAGHVHPKPYYATDGAIFMVISIHNVPPDEYDTLSYQPNVLTNRDSFYYHDSFLAGVRAIDYIFSMDEFDGESLGVMGTSQGGGLSMVLAGLDNRVKLLIEKVGALCEHSGYKYNRTCGFPRYLRTAHYTGDAEAAASEVKYYDAVYFAKRYKGPVLGVVSWEDQTCSPATGTSALNQMTGTKIVMNALEHGHGSPSVIHDIQFDFMRLNFPNMYHVPFPLEFRTTGYFAEAGTPVSTTINTSVNLQGRIEYNQEQVTDLPVRWTKTSGPGKMTFTNPGSNATMATFSHPGTYILKFEATYLNFPSDEPVMLTISDSVEVTVTE